MGGWSKSQWLGAFALAIVLVITSPSLFAWQEVLKERPIEGVPGITETRWQLERRRGNAAPDRIQVHRYRGDGEARAALLYLPGMHMNGYLPGRRGEVGWCQGYSEPGAGSDLASLRTRAEDQGDHFLINGQKIWTSGAQFADWMFAIVRTDPDVPKHEGISFVLLPMDQEGVTVKPIRLISGTSPFCETFFDDAIVKKEDLVGELNKGWTVAKRLLQFERSGQGGLGAGGGGRRGRRGSGMADVAKEYLGEEDGRIADADVRAKIIRYDIDSAAFALTQRRVGEENRSGKTLGEATSIFKLYGSNLARDGAEMRQELMGIQGLGWEGDAFSSQELGATRGWLSSRAITIYGGTNEIQMNIIAKRVLGLPD